MVCLSHECSEETGVMTNWIVEVTDRIGALNSYGVSTHLNEVRTGMPEDRKDDDELLGMGYTGAEL